MAAGAVAWAIAVLGIATNRPFGVFLLVVAFVLFVAAHREEALRNHWKTAGWGKRIGAVVAVLTCAGLGWYLATHFNAAQSVTVDEQARRQAEEARTEIGALRTELAERTTAFAGQVAALEAQLKTAMQFQETEKAAREADQKQRAGEQERRDRIVNELTGVRRRLTVLRSQCGTLDPKVFIATATKLVEDAVSFLQSNKMENDAQRLADGTATGLPDPRGFSTDCGKYGENARAIFGLNARIYVIDAIVKELTR